VSLYWIVNLAGMIVFGEAAWRERAEPFGIFFGLVGGLSPLARERSGGRTTVSLAFPGAMLIGRVALPLSGILFVLLTLASVSFDGLSRTFAWLAFIGINPLEFPGRSAVVGAGTAGLLGTWTVLAAAFLGAVAGGAALIGRGRDALPAAGRLVYSIVPIAAGFQFAHYLTALSVDLQYARIVASDPLALGWNLFGTADDHITMSYMNTFEGVALIWNAQTAAIALGHIVGITMAHVIALTLFGARRAATLSQVFLAALMVFYTAFGLWLLSTPRI
jgi:hypothetical protein